MSGAATPSRPPAQIMGARVMHLRLRPVQHRFVYSVFCVRVDLARTQEAGNAWFGVDRHRLMSIHTRDYGPRDGSNLELWVRQRLHEAGVAADGEIWLQTFPRVFGYVFNPVSFFLCHDRAGALRAVLVEVNNTFGETLHYLLSAADGAAVDGQTTLSCAKLLHVSPFCEVRGFYRFRFQERDNSASVSIDYHDSEAPADDAVLPPPLIRTAIGGRLYRLTATRALVALCSQPLMTFGITARIHWQALLLWRKRVPWFRKPAAPRAAHQQAHPPADQNTPSRPVPQPAEEDMPS